MPVEQTTPPIVTHSRRTWETELFVVRADDRGGLIQRVRALDDYLDALDRLVPEGRWRHDRIDNNGAAHIKSATVGPAEIVPVSNGDLALGTWQNIFLCEFDGPRAARRVLVTVHGD